MKTSVSAKAFAMLLSAGLVAGCSSTGETVDEGGYGSDVAAIDQDGGSTVYGGDDGSGISSSGLTDEERQAAQEQAEQQALRDITVFYFDFDTSEIKPDTRDVLVAHARYLADNPRSQVRLEGHADERGTKEYNLALGERRANAVQRFLIVNGVSRGQIETISYGEEKPAVRGGTESAHAQNRRVELVFP
ncbi:peptidoglycan-associated lipoprotein Pal [Marinobacter daepoensis]|uniref:Peptidoglycan-associated lipoprotein n=1 Tax=Marinobacter daepoensis TaxID=262077 RepID=A0ABS3BCK3_9GAMM|nr:peptidoglycan-associated lipoprotein Pal [Marinobacter daepoensis]MBN7769364.1 peptidoglycan-associated lipoprotein Pal [Marinobacter daepoensis]MBY6031974.1 peptidoglycan-associated lipoprotein Pal [Marinobacter daepoensis]MBY6078054.1 peptidoglycan-associated lipoprotein Pal [Marinobacter daepoensis]